MRIVIMVNSRGEQIVLDGATRLENIPEGRYTIRAIESGDMIKTEGPQISWRAVGVGAIAMSAVALLGRWQVASSGVSAGSMLGGDRRAEVVERLWRVCRVDARHLGDRQLEDAERNCRQGVTK